MPSRHARSITKAFTYRAISTVCTVFFIFLVTQRLEIALYVLLFDIFFLTSLYYCHERLWKKIRWGKFER